jgi:Uma2 family endonuclease
MPPAGGEHGFTTNKVSVIVSNFVAREALGFVFAAETGYLIERDPGTVRAPDCSFVRAGRLTRPFPRGFLPLAPDLVVETLSPDDRPGKVQEKVGQWLASGVRLLWVLDPPRQEVTVHRPGVPPKVLSAADLLDGEDVLPGFRVRVSDLFE